jgi:hypothetical protein
MEMNGFQWNQRGLAMGVVQDQFTHTPLNNLVRAFISEYTPAPSFTGTADHFVKIVKICFLFF